jgi:hypothetical protein
MRVLFALFFITSIYSSENFIPILKKISIRGESVNISSPCTNCIAQKNYLSLEKVQVEKVRKHVFGGRTWGSQVCLKVFKARIVSSFDSDQNEAHYCLFKDSSYISTDELNYLAMKLIK